jgi:hypothetical protein
MVTRAVATCAWLWTWVMLLPSGWVEVIPLSTVLIWMGMRWLRLEWRPVELIVLGVVSMVGFGKVLLEADWDHQLAPELGRGLGFVLSVGWILFGSLPILGLSRPWRRVLQAGFAASLTLWATQTGACLFGWPPMVILWTGLGFLFVAAGLWRRMATLRHAGFGLLALSFAKLFLVDVWAFGTFTRVMAFIALGVALVALGFFYNRFATVLKRLLESEDEEP